MRRTVKIRQQVLSPWVSLVERTVSDGGTEALYHSFSQADYVSIVAVTSSEELVCVRQYRPAVDQETLELPGGLLGDGEDPLDCVVRELAEETGFRAVEAPLPLGCLLPDTGRLENRFWSFFCEKLAPVPSWSSEAEVARCLVPLRDLRELILTGTFNHALHIAALGVCAMRGLLPILSMTVQTTDANDIDCSK